MDQHEGDMGKKKDKRERKAHEQAAANHGDEHGCGHGTGHGEGHGTAHAGGSKHGGAAPLAGIAAAIARQMGTPVGRQMIAAGLMAAADAISRHDSKPTAARPSPTPPAPPAAPPPPADSVASAKSDTDAEPPRGSTGPFAGDKPEPPRSDAPALPPEMAKVLDSVTVGLERLFAGFGKPTGAAPKKDPSAS